jgi:hypothetical protein
MARKTPEVRKVLAAGRKSGARLEKPVRKNKSFSRGRFGMDPTVSTSINSRNAQTLGANDGVVKQALGGDETQRLANQVSKMRQQLTNRRASAPPKSFEKNPVAVRRAGLINAGKTGGLLAGAAAVGTMMNDSMQRNEAAVNQAKSLERQGKPNNLADAGMMDARVGQQQGRQFNERGQATAAKSKTPAAKSAPAKSAPAKSAAPANAAKITKLLMKK